MRQKEYSLAYRQAYYAVDPEQALQAAVRPRGIEWTAPPSPRPAGDSLDANMQYGAPIVHGLIFGAHVGQVNRPKMATPEQMAQLADEPAFFKTRRKSRPAKALAPIELQHYRIDYTVMARQLHLSGADAVPRLEIAIAAYDREGTRLNASVSVASSENGTGVAQQKSYRVEQEFLAPANATTLRMAVRDPRTDRIGAMEIPLPLQPETRASASLP